VRFEVVRTPGALEALGPKIDGLGTGARGAGRQHSTGARGASAGRFATSGRFAVRGRRGLNRLRFSGRIRGRPLAPGSYALRAVAVDLARRTSAPLAVPFRIGHDQD
jgi:hypothetical protein